VRDGLDTEGATTERELQRAVHGRVVVLEEQAMETLDVARPGPGLSVDELGDEVERGLTDLEELLPHQVGPAALSGNGGDHLGL
jgi:hypothetical protein